MACHHRRHRHGRAGGPGRKPYDGLLAWPDGSLGLLSFALSQRFGGTPWQWRSEASEMDWGTGLEILRREQEEHEEEV
nr:MAG TPA: hypothetical protein [Caudoviricetes sp.]